MMNTREIRAEFYTKMDNIQYDMNRNNDALDWSFLTDRKNYRPLEQRFRLAPLPQYASNEEWNRTTWQMYLKRIVFGAIMLKAGYHLGTWDSKDELL